MTEKTKNKARDKGLRIVCYIQKKNLVWTVCVYELWLVNLLPGFQSDDDEDGSPVHAAYTAAVAHEVIQDGGKLSPHLKFKAMNTINKLMLMN